MSHILYPSLSEIVGHKYVADSGFAVWAYAKDSSAFPARVPGIVVRPGTTEEVSQIVKLANRERVPMHMCLKFFKIVDLAGCPVSLQPAAQS